MHACPDVTHSCVFSGVSILHSSIMVCGILVLLQECCGMLTWCMHGNCMSLLVPMMTSSIFLHAIYSQGVAEIKAQLVAYWCWSNSIWPCM